MCDDKMEPLPVVATESTNNTDIIILDQIGSNIPEKRPFEESEDSNEKEQKKCKIDHEENNVHEEHQIESKNDDEANNKPISKTQMKKMRKHQIWLKNKEKRKAINKEKKEVKKVLKAKMKNSGEIIQKPPRMRRMSESLYKHRIVIDMSYYNLMKDKDLNKCCSQVLRCYSLNRRMENPMQFYISSFEGKIKQAMKKFDSTESWNVNYMEESFIKVFEKEELVYLTSDSENVLDIIDENKVYIIGGLVDHNSCKNASLNIANNLGIAHARLPIDEYINMLTRKVLTINHVFEIISKIVTGVTWKDAFMNTIPKRKMIWAKDEEINLNFNDNSPHDEPVVDQNECSSNTVETINTLNKNMTIVDEVNLNYKVPNDEQVIKEEYKCPIIDNNSHN